MSLSKTQTDKLGERLKAGSLREEDLRELDEYRRSFGAAHDRVVGMVRDELGLEPTGRSAKSTASIIAKLRRESIRLTQMQDIAGCRVVVSDVAAQNTAVQGLFRLFPIAEVIDRCLKPSHGYRAVHVVVFVLEKLVEVQVRTELQHLWAEVSERLSDVVDPEIKYGGGPTYIATRLAEESRLLHALEFDRIEGALKPGLEKAMRVRFERLLQLVSNLGTEE